MKVILTKQQTNSVLIEFEANEYLIDLDKLVYVLNKLSNQDIDKTNIDAIKQMMRKYKLFDEDFLYEISKEN